MMESLSTQNHNLEVILSNIDQIVWYIETDSFALQYINEAVFSVFGSTKEELLESPNLWQNYIHQDDRSLVFSFFQNLDAGSTQEISFRIHHADGSLKWLDSRIFHNEKLALFIGITTDITETKNKSEEIAFLAYNDPLTMLPNRARLKLQLDSYINQAHPTPFTLIFIDLDNFKKINDTMGHETGDQILIQIGERIRTLIEDDHFPARFGGDEFIILYNTDDILKINHFCEHLITLLQLPFEINNIQFFLSASIGISIFLEDAKSQEGLIKHADIAMYEAKKSGKNRYVYYDSFMKHSIADFINTETLIRDALALQQFELYFQPLINSQNFELQGFEALLRLNHPAHGFIDPVLLISVAEANGDIIKIGHEVLRQACNFISATQKIYSKPFYVAINTSAKQLYQTGFADELLKYLKLHSIDPDFLKLEVTESTIMENIPTATHQLQILKNGGIKISLDDFGTGYSSLASLAQLPINTLKIDKSFVQSFSTISSHRHIIEAIANLARALQMDITAEGIETAEQCHFLRENQIDTFQGYFFSKPLSSTEILEILSQSTPRYFSEKYISLCK